MSTSNCAATETPKSLWANVDVTTLSEKEQRTLVAMALELLAARHAPGEPLNSPADTKAFLQLELAEARHEVFGCVLLDNRHRVLGVETLFFGTINAAAVYPRVVVQCALEKNAAALVLFHNHPSGVAEPSRSDCHLTKRLEQALGLIDVRVLDHLIVSADEATSFSELGLL